jgi:RimJ/RimL family protein N-acetyltransferase
MASTMFKSDRLVYRGVEDNDADRAFFLSLQLDSVATANSSPRLMKPPNKESATSFLNWVKNDALIGVLICLPASSDQPATPVGFILLQKATDQEHHRKATITLGIQDGHQGKGYGGEAIKWILNWAFQISGMHRIAISCIAYNEGARRLYERLHFKYEGQERDSIWFNGGWHDLILLSMLESEWREHYGK